MNPNNPTEVCKNCFFFAKFADVEEGRCHRNPPVAVSSMHSYFASTRTNLWCGEYKARGNTLPAPTMPSKGQEQCNAIKNASRGKTSARRGD